MAKSGDDDDAYEVGYGRPPKGTRFKPGRSGNPRGRPKEVKTVDDALRKRLFQKVTAQENGRKTRITVLEVIVTKIVNAAAQGDSRSIALLLKQMPRLQAASEAAEAGEGSPEQDRQVLMELAKITGVPLETLIRGVEEEQNA